MSTGVLFNFTSNTWNKNIKSEKFYHLNSFLWLMPITSVPSNLQLNPFQVSEVVHLPLLRPLPNFSARTIYTGTDGCFIRAFFSPLFIVWYDSSSWTLAFAVGRGHKKCPKKREVRGPGQGLDRKRVKRKSWGWRTWYIQVGWGG